MKRLLILIPSLVLLSGCTGAGSIAKQLKNDPAIVVVRMGTPWGVQSLTRIGGQTNSVTVSPEGQVTINNK